MAAQALSNPTLAGTAQAMVAASAGGDSFPLPVPLIIRVTNGGGVGRNVTIVAQKACNQGVLHSPPAIAVAAGTTVEIRVQDVDRFRDVNGRIQLTYDSEVGLTLAAYAAGS
jgi:hypothetical protein